LNKLTAALRSIEFGL